MSAFVRHAAVAGSPQEAPPSWGSPKPAATPSMLWPVLLPKVMHNVIARLGERGAPLAGLAEVKKLRLLDSAEIEQLLHLVQSGHPAMVQAYRATLLDRSAYALALRLAALVQVSPTSHAVSSTFSPAPAGGRYAPAETPPSLAAYHHAFLPGTPPPPPGIAAPYSGARSVSTPSHTGFFAPPLPASPAFHTPQQQLVAVSPPSGQSTSKSDAAQDMWRFICRLQQRGDMSHRALQLCAPLVRHSRHPVTDAWQQLVHTVSAAESTLLAQLERSPRSAWGDAQQVRATRRLQEHKSDAENTFLWSLADALVASHGDLVLSEFSHKALGLDGPHGAPPLPTEGGGGGASVTRMPVPTPLGSPESSASQDEDWMGIPAAKGYGNGAPPSNAATQVSSKSSTSDSAWLGQVNTPPFMQNGHFISPTGSGGGLPMPPPTSAADRMHSAAGAFPYAPLMGVLHNIQAMGLLPAAQLGRLSAMVEGGDVRLAAAFGAWEAAVGDSDGELMPLIHRVCAAVQQAMPGGRHSGQQGFDGVAASAPDAPLQSLAGQLVHSQVYNTGGNMRYASDEEQFEVVETLSGGEVAEGESEYPPPHPHAAYAQELGAQFVDTSYASLAHYDEGGAAMPAHGMQSTPLHMDLAHLGNQHAELVGHLRSVGRISGSDATTLRHMWADGDSRVRAAWAVAGKTGDTADLTQTLLTILEQELASASATTEHVLHVVDGMADLQRISARQAEVLRSIVHLAARGDSFSGECDTSAGGSGMAAAAQRSISAPGGSGAFPFGPRSRTSSFYVHTSEAQDALHTITQALAGGSKGAAGEGVDSLQGILTAVAEEWIAATSASTPRSSNSAGGSGPKGSRAGTDLSEASTGTATRNVDTIAEASDGGASTSAGEGLNVDTSPRPDLPNGGAAPVRGFSRESDLPWIEESGGDGTPEALRELEACAASGGDARAGSREWILVRITRLVKGGELNDAQASVLTQLANSNDSRLWGALEAYKALCLPDDGGGAYEGGGSSLGAGGMCSPDGDLDDTLVRLAVISLEQVEARAA